MCISTFNHTTRTYRYLIKVSIVLVLYLLSARLGDFLNFIDVFNHGQYPPYWPPSGVAFALILLLGGKVWPGIALASLILIPESYWFLENDPHISDVIIVSSGFTIGRVLEPLVGYHFFRKVSRETNPFKNPKTSINFVITTLIISVIGAGMSSTAIQIASPATTEIYLVRMGAWYIDNVVGILVFSPFILAVYYFATDSGFEKRKHCKLLWILWLPLMLAVAYLFYLIHPKLTSTHIAVINCLPFLVIPFLFWLAFKYHMAISSFAVIITSLIAIYLTTRGIGPFVLDGDWHMSVLLLQSFLLVATISILISAAVSNERKTNERQLMSQALQLQQANQSLISTMNHLNEARNKAEESDQLKSAFLRNLSHEIRTPMNAVLGFAELLERPNLHGDKREAFMKLIRERSKILLGTLNDILYISMITSGQMSSVTTVGSMDDFLQRALEKFKSENNHLENKNISVTLTNECSMPDRHIQADFNNLQQVLANLLANAAKFTHEGYIEIKCVRQHPHELLFSVSDSGIGVPAEQRDLIFQPFRHGSQEIHQNYGGTGLGLAICKGLIELWKGRIWIESQMGKGTIFYFTMPFIPA